MITGALLTALYPSGTSGLSAPKAVLVARNPAAAQWLSLPRWAVTRQERRVPHLYNTRRVPKAHALSIVLLVPSIPGRRAL